MEAPLLSVDGVNKHFVGIPAFRDLTFMVQLGEVVGLIGPNGAGNLANTSLQISLSFYFRLRK